MKEIVRLVGSPVGGWLDKQGKFHMTHVEHAERLNAQLTQASLGRHGLRP